MYKSKTYSLSPVAGRHSANLVSPIWNAFIRLRRNNPSVLDTSSHFLTGFTNHKRPYNLCPSQHPLSIPPRFMMGIPQDSHSKSKNKDKSKTKTKTKNASHKTKPSSTMPASTSSSMDPHNGSAIDHGGQSSRRHGHNAHSHPSRDSRQTPHQTQTHTVNGGQDCHDPQAYDTPYNSAHTYAMYPPEQRVPVPPAAHYGEEQYYYSSDQVYTNDAGAYAPELRLDEDQVPSQDPLCTSSSSVNQYDQPADHGYYRPQSPIPQHVVQQHVSTSFTTARWNREPTPEERLRLGLSRRATQAEVEAARRAYEDATQQADRYGPAPQ